VTPNLNPADFEIHDGGPACGYTEPTLRCRVCGLDIDEYGGEAVGLDEIIVAAFGHAAACVR
jgi:hypothetical protein